MKKRKEGLTMNHKRIQIFDTTLRDGEQAPGCALSVGDKIAVAKQLAWLGSMLPMPSSMLIRFSFHPWMRDAQVRTFYVSLFKQ
jgi:hypothetical protein